MLFIRFWQRKALKTIEDSFDNLTLLKDFGKEANIKDNDVWAADTKFMSNLYGYMSNDLDEVHYRFFTKKNFDSTKLPPTNCCRDMLIQMANFQTFVWTHALQLLLMLTSVVSRGWDSDEEGLLFPSFLNTEVAPTSIVELTVCSC